MLPIRPVSVAVAVVALAGATVGAASAEPGAASEARPGTRAPVTHLATQRRRGRARVAEGQRLCDNLADCQFVETGQPMTGWSPWQILGGQVDNCSTTSAASYETDISDERGESNTTREGLSLTATAEIRAVAKASIEAKATSSQMGRVATVTSETTTVNIGGEEKGWVETQVWTANLTYQVKDLVHNILLIPAYQVSVPGYAFPSDDVFKAGVGVQDRSFHPALTSDEMNACHALTP